MNPKCRLCEFDINEEKGEKIFKRYIKYHPGEWYCEYCVNLVKKKTVFEKEFEDYEEIIKKLNSEIKEKKEENNNLKDELESERNTNLEMLEKLKILNENKLAENLLTRDKEFKNLNYKIDQLAEKLNCLTEQK